MVHKWGPLATVCAVLLLVTGRNWPRANTSSLASTEKALVDPAVASYEGFDPAHASLKLVQVVFRHGARTPLNTVYSFPGANWTHCIDHYQGVEVELYDENGGKQAPPILDEDEPVLPGGCRQGTLTEAGYGLALDLGGQLRNRYVEGGSGSTAGFLPDLAAAGAGGWDPSVASLRTTPIRRTVATLRGVLTGLWPRLAEATGSTAAAAAGHRLQQQQQQQLQHKRRGLRAAAAALPVGASVEPLEIMYGNNRTCARLVPLHDAMQRDLEAADARDAELPRLNRLVAEALDLDPSKAILWPKLYDTLAAMIADGLPLPPGATQEVLDTIWAQAERHEAAIIGPGADVCDSLGPGGGGPLKGPDGGDDGDADSPAARSRRCHEVLRLGIGMLVRRLLDNMERQVQSEAQAAAGEERGAAAGMAGRRRLLAAASSGATDHQPLLTEGGGGGAATGAGGSAQGREEEQLRQQPLAEETEGAEGAGTGGLAAPSRLYLFSGHDSSLTPLLAVLGQPARAWPHFTANVIFELWQAGSRGAAGAAAAGPRRGLRSASWAAPVAPEYWVRVLYNGSPLVVPGVSDTGGWAPLGTLRQRVLLPYAITPADHTAACARADISDLASPRAPATSLSQADRLFGGGIRDNVSKATTTTMVSQAAGAGAGASASASGGARRSAHAAARERAIRHAML